MEGRETDLEYNLLMGLTGASVSKHLLDEHFTLYGQMTSITI